MEYILHIIYTYISTQNFDNTNCPIYFFLQIDLIDHKILLFWLNILKKSPLICYSRSRKDFISEVIIYCECGSLKKWKECISKAYFVYKIYKLNCNKIALYLIICHLIEFNTKRRSSKNENKIMYKSNVIHIYNCFEKDFII